MLQTLLLAAVFPATLPAQEFPVPSRGIEETATPNRYLYGSRVIGEDRVFLAARTTLSFNTTSGAAARFTAEPHRRFLMHIYNGPVSARWRTNIRSLSALSLGQLGAGITGELAATGQALSVRLHVQPGADLASVSFRFDSGAIPVTSQLVAGVGAGVRWMAGDEQGTLFSPRVSSAAQDFPPPSVGVTFESGGARFRLRPFLSGDGERLPYTVTIPLEQPRSSGRVNMLGTDLAGQTWATFEDMVARFDSTGALASLSVLASRSSWNGIITPTGALLEGAAAPDSPVPPSAAQPAVRGPADGLLAAVDTDGLLLDATYVGGDGFDTVLLTGTGSNGAAHFQGSGSAPVPVTPGVAWRTPPATDGGEFLFFGKWTPRRNRFDFLSYGPSASFRSAPAPGGAVVTYNSPDPTATPNAITVALLDHDGVGIAGSLLTVRLTDLTDIVSREPGPVAMNSAGHLWLTGSFRHVNGGIGNVLMRFGRGSRAPWTMLGSWASPGITYELKADPVNGDFHHFVTTRQNSLGSQRDSPYRGACLDGGVYYQKLTATGGFLNGTYLPASPSAFVAPGGTLDWFSYRGGVLEESVATRETPDAANGPPAIACFVDHASRRPQPIAARGQLVTLIGQRLGPLDARAGNLVTELAGTRVLLDGEPVGLANVQAGLVTFRVPADYAKRTAQLVVERDGQVSAPVTVPIADLASFGAFTTDGQGWGPAAFFGNPEPGGDVSLFATGLDQAHEAYLLIDERHIVKAAYVGPTQHLLPGIQQINFRLPADVRRGGLVTVSLSPQLPALPGGWPEARVTLPVN
ncbi:MAG: hypothetical protein IT162_14650 [Bryobacterales bacterium]|nr:hypothetical protein [Bryobacterales bacterium]